MEHDGVLTPIKARLPEKDLTCFNVMDTPHSDDTIIIPQYEQGQISHNFNIRLPRQMDMPDFDLLEILEQAPMGKAIISYYNTNNCLNNYFRNKLVDIIMKHLFSYHCKQ